VRTTWAGGSGAASGMSAWRATTSESAPFAAAVRSVCAESSSMDSQMAFASKRSTARNTSSITSWAVSARTIAELTAASARRRT
jgi:hypothetical protein